MKYDCSKTLDYVHEFNRMCDTNEEFCVGCLLNGMGCSTDYISQKHIDIVQKWSDNHPEQTYLEYYKELLPDLKIELETGYPKFRPCWVEGDAIPCGNCYCDNYKVSGKSCWDIIRKGK